MNHSFQQVLWKDVRKSVSTVNPELSNIIDQLDPDPSYTLFVANYKYGDMIIKSGKLHLPSHSSRLSPIDSPSVDSRVKEELGYNFGTNPVTLLLKKSVEIFYILDNQTIPLYGLLKPGSVFSTWGILSKAESHGPVFLWDMTAGARSVFMLPKISETMAHNRICTHLGASFDKPNRLLEHWSIFKEISRHMEDAEHPWTSSLLFFGKKWFESLNDPGFANLHKYLLTAAWEGSNFFRHQFIWNAVYALIQRERNTKPDPYIAATVRHLIAMGVGVTPGFAPAYDEQGMPITNIQQIYREIYRIKYAPIIMQPALLTADQINNPLYYSIEYPSTLEVYQRSREDRRKITDLILVRSLMSKYLEAIKYGDLNVHMTPIGRIPDSVSYAYFHSLSKYKGISDSAELVNLDPIFKSIEGVFPGNSPFLKGCIQVAFKS